MPARKHSRLPDAEAGAAAPAAVEPSERLEQHAYSYQRKYTRCHKPGCRRCADGPGHGPYWYAFWWEGGRTRSRYLGKTAPADATAPAVPGDSPSVAPAANIALRVQALGRFSVCRDGAPVPESAWSRRTSIALFKLLLSTPGHRLLRDQVCDLLWPDADPATVGVALRGATHGIRRALDLPSHDSVITGRDGVLAIAGTLDLWIDAEAFAAAASQALAGRSVDACRAALALYKGEYLSDDLYEDWTRRRREELADLRIAVLLHQARVCGEEGDMAEARAALAAVLATDPAHEEAACRQMTLLAAMGERTEALRLYQRLRAALQEQFGLEPGDEVTNLAQSLQVQQAARVAGPVTPRAPRRSNLPRAQSTFIGRRDAQNTVRELLRTSRLVTLSGAGGSGKTRLAIRIADLLLDTYADGAWLCELAGLARVAEHGGVTSGSDPVASAVAGALGIVEEPGHSLMDTICAFLEPRRLLLLLDNCEHLLGPAAALVAVIVARCADVTVLVTSQEALGLPSEVTWTVPPLALPEPEASYSPEALGQYDAVRLFVERSRSARPGFTLDEATAPLVVEICRRLDGIPLAIELAAARTAFLSLEMIVARLDDRFHLLVGGSRIALPRHQTLRAAMDWSYSLLGAKERILLRRLTVFAGGCTLVAAEGVCADAALPAPQVLDVLGGLVAKSLVVVQEDGNDLRYGMLETVRQYGRARLADSQEEPATLERHLSWFAQHCEETIAAWSSVDQATLLRSIDVDLENIRSALSWGLAERTAALPALQLASSLSRYWTTRGLVGEGRRWTASALEAAPDAPRALRATALNRCGILARLEGDSSATRELWEASLMLFRALGDAEGVARVAGNLGLLRYDQGDDEGAVTALTESIDLKRQQHNPQEVAISLLNLGMVHTRLKRYADGEAAFAEAGRIWQTAGDQAGMSLVYLNTAHLARDQEQHDRAANLYAESLRISLELGDRPQMPTALEGMAHVLLRRRGRGSLDRTMPRLCARLLACAAALRESTGVSIHTANQTVYRADLQLLQKLIGARKFEGEWSTGWNTPLAALLEEIPAQL